MRTERQSVSNASRRTPFVFLLACALAWSSEVEAYTPPKPGWLYVVDSPRDPSGATGRVLLIDPDGGNIISSFPAGAQPEIALSADGRRLYVAHGFQNEAGRLQIIDTRTGKLLKELLNPDRWVTTGFSYFRTLALSPDDSRLFQFKMHAERTAATYYIDVLDTATSAFIPGRAPLPSCVSAVLFDADPTGIKVLCLHTHDLRAVSVDDDGPKIIDPGVRKAIPTAKDHVEIGTGFHGANGRLLVIGGAGDVFELENAPAPSFVNRGKLRGLDGSRPATSPTTAQLDEGAPVEGRTIAPQSPIVSPDGLSLFVGVDTLDIERRRSVGARFDRIAVVDTRTLEVSRNIDTSVTFGRLVLSPDGYTLYGMSAETESIVVIDTLNSREIRRIELPGSSPVSAVVVP